MRISCIAFAIVISGMPGVLQARTKPHQAKTRTQQVKSSAQNVHKVRKGETDALIARENGLTLEELADLNPKVKLNRLSVGTTLKVAAARKPAKALPLPAQEAAPRVRAAKAGKALQAIAPLPETPALGPASLVHLEGVLPAEVRPPIPAGSANQNASLTPSSTPALAELRTVLPERPAAQPGVESPVSLAFDPADPDKLDLLWPVETRTVSSAWGPRMRSRTRVVKVRAKRQRRVKVRYRGSHRGVDLNAPSGTDVFAALDGKVLVSGKHRQYGNYVVLDHGNGVVTLYAHHTRNFVHEGEVVRRGQKIAEVGATGNATGPHLHFELRVDGNFRNPLPYLNEVEEIPADMLAENKTAAPASRQ
jgi:murein DD-endopeptidase MepM/ murein hydrolase activator NlpD